MIASTQPGSPPPHHHPALPPSHVHFHSPSSSPSKQPLKVVTNLGLLGEINSLQTIWVPPPPQSVGHRQRRLCRKLFTSTQAQLLRCVMEHANPQQVIQLRLFNIVRGSEGALLTPPPTPPTPLQRKHPFQLNYRRSPLRKYTKSPDNS